MNSKTLIQTDGFGAVGSMVRAEIFQQPELWPDTLGRVVEIIDRCDLFPCDSGAVITGAGSSAHAARAIEAAWPGARAVPSTDLLINAHPYFAHPYFGPDSILVSLARSGESPESAAVVRNIQRLFPRVRHLAITCNAQGHLARVPGAAAIVLDPRTNDRSLAMTSSFSNLVLAGICLEHAREIAEILPRLCARLRQNLPVLDSKAQAIATDPVNRVVVLASAPLMGWAQEASLKILEMSAGRIPVMAETHLGLRHGPMTFLRPDTLVVSLLSSDPLCRRYEEDLLAELGAKKLGRIVAITSDDTGPTAFGEAVPAMAPEMPDSLRTPFEIVFPQLLAYHLSLRADLNPDDPSPNGVIHRVVQGVRIYEG